MKIKTINGTLHKAATGQWYICPEASNEAITLTPDEAWDEMLTADIGHILETGIAKEFKH